MNLAELLADDAAYQQERIDDENETRLIREMERLDAERAALSEAAHEDAMNPGLAAARRGGGYENAPATRMLATNCAVCRRPLVDSVSVDVGVGPDCRRKYGFDRHVDEAARREANQLVYQVALVASNGHIALPQVRATTVASATKRLRELGFDKLADVIEKRAFDVRITVEGNQFAVKAPYNELATELFRRISGRRWHAKDCSCARCNGGGERKVTTFPVAQKPAVFAALVRAYLHMVAIGPKGAFVIGGAR